MSIMDLFRSAVTPSPATGAAPAVNTPTPAPASPPTPGNIPPQTATTAQGVTSPATAPNGTVPATTPLASPLDAFAEIWQTPANPNAPVPGAPLLNVDPAKLQEAARKVNFTQQGITQDQMAKINAGGQEAMLAMMEVMNTVAQNTYAQSAIAATKIVEGAMGKAQSNLDARLPDIIKRHNVSDTIRTNNPAFSHPAVAPILQALEQQLVTKYPNATAAELNGMAKQYMEAAGAAFIPQQQTPQNVNGVKPGETDWSTFLQ